jgi:hypothetical protein
MLLKHIQSWSRRHDMACTKGTEKVGNGQVNDNQTMNNPEEVGLRR